MKMIGDGDETPQLFKSEQQNSNYLIAGGEALGLQLFLNAIDVLVLRWLAVNVRDQLADLLTSNGLIVQPIVFTFGDEQLNEFVEIFFSKLPLQNIKQSKSIVSRHSGWITLAEPIERSASKVWAVVVAHDLSLGLWEKKIIEFRY